MLQEKLAEEIRQTPQIQLTFENSQENIHNLLDTSQQDNDVDAQSNDPSLFTGRQKTMSWQEYQLKSRQFKAAGESAGGGTPQPAPSTGLSKWAAIASQKKGKSPT